LGLQKYRRKRDFHRTPEPAGAARSAQRSRRYVIQKHAARRLHYDFRLEMDGVLKSWAVPKGPTLDPGEKRLAVHVEDHPIEYGGFEGVIPRGQYGAGKVLLWDRGTWQPEADPEAAYRKGHLRFRLAGRKLHGRWSLVRMGKPARDGKENWLLIKGRDAEARTGRAAEVTERETESVESGREIEGITERAGSAGGQPEGARRKAMPSMVKPQFATLVDSVPRGEGWLYEAKLDGYRMLCRVRGGRAQLFTRNANDWTARMKPLAEAAAELTVNEAWLDGEVVVVRPDGTTNFQDLQNAFERGSNAQIVYFLFDLLYLDGRDLTGTPLHERKRLLRGLLDGADGRLRYSDHLEESGERFYEQACHRHLEGIIAKRRDDPYVGRRTRSWVKVKCRREQEFVIGGYTAPKGSRSGFGALLIGVHDKDGQLHYAGKVGTGFNDEVLRRLHKRLNSLETDKPPFANPPTGAEGHRAHWVKPTLVAEIAFAEWTGDGRVRQAAFNGLREDKPARAIIRETAAPAPDARDKPRYARSMRRGKPVMPTGKTAETTDNGNSVAGVRLSHPDRVLFPDTGLTKLGLARYYESVAEWILPDLKNRPLTLVRCPRGAGQQCFYQKHLDEAAPDAVRQVKIRESKGTRLYAVAEDVGALVGLVQMGVLEFHGWQARADEIERPDRFILDLDPDPAVSWKRVVEAAQLAHALLDEIGLRSFLKTTGGKGLHVVVPIERRHGWDDVKGFAQAVAQHMAHAIPERFTANPLKQKRKGKIFVDYLRNGRGATAIVAYSTRARPGAPVAVPLAWEELSPHLKSDHFNVENVLDRLRRQRRDPWKGYGSVRQSLSADMKRRLGGK
jgi:bifunctional non-homologous end joining protein LigD